MGERLVSEQYCLEDREWREALARRIRSQVVDSATGTGVATLAGFLSASSLSDAASEAREKASRAFVSSQAHNAYLLPDDDPTLPATHVRNLKMKTNVASVACDELDPHRALHKLYFGSDGDRLLDLISSVVGKQMYRLADPLGAVSINVFKPGMEHAWHFDESEYTITICLQKAEQGGDFLYSKPLRKDHADLAEQFVEDVMACPQERTSRLEFEPGTLSFFCGQRSLHCVTKVEGTLDRLVAVLCFSSTPGVKNSRNVQKQFWGRSKL